jgi:ABC-type lipoprotein release transport system permease subunit
MTKSSDRAKYSSGRYDAFRVGNFLAFRALKRANIWTTILIVFIMMLTFLNLVFVSGILSGLVEGSSNAYRAQYSADLILSNLESKNFIEDTAGVEKTVRSFPEVVALTSRMLAGATVEANYKTKTNMSDNTESVATSVAGIDPAEEDAVTRLSGYVVAGSYLASDDVNGILVGSNLLERYVRNVPGSDTLSAVDVGDTIRLRVNGTMREFVIRGVVKSKISAVSQRVYMNETILRQLLGRSNKDANEIAVLLQPGTDPAYVKSGLQKAGICSCAKIETWQESQGQFFTDIGTTFDILGTVIGAIGISVASITVFIVIFINAVTRRKYIGILQGIGVSPSAITVSYVLQSLFYAFVGSAIGSAILFGFLKPYIDANPIDFPFSDGILVAPVDLTLIRIGIIIIVTIIAGYIPARIIVGKNILDSILGR